jgi:CheY-like chemotaxis protein
MARGAGGAGLGVRPLQSHRSGFWGKLSHELRSPLNSVLVLSQLLSENEEHNLTGKQVAFAKAIHASGNDLLALINAISDLSKIETHRLVLEPTEMPFEHFKAHLERAFEPVARERGLEFAVVLEPGLPASFVTDAKRLRQIMKCLLSNAFKFTESGRVSVTVSSSRSGWSADRERLNNAREVVAFSVTDTGVGMSESEQRSILEVFPPERIESRRGLGASGLGLAISRELSRLLGGDLRVASVVGSGSTFTLYLPTCGLPAVASETAPPDSQSSAPASAPSSSAFGSRPAPAISGPASSSGGSRDNEPGPRRSGAGRARGKRRDAEAASATELSGLHIMLVDDDVRSAFALTGLLERHGAAVSHAEEVSEALQRLGEGGGLSALLIDAELLLSGSEASLRHVLDRCGRLPIIALTSPRLLEGEAAERVPPEVHRLAKPVAAAELMALLRGVTGRGKPLES